MEASKRLVMTFKSAGGNTVNLTVADPKESLTETQVIDAMNLIIEKNIFCPGEVDLKEAVKARVVETYATEYDLKL
ncbi:Protein of uncharacterised function (DUF2922) [uncultured Clostridium sp.]|nr:Protein of uncharacterised function (DUF2922) [uncultured Clostridium sp.]